MMWGYGFDGFQWLWMGLMMLFPLLITVGVIILVVWLVRREQDIRHGVGRAENRYDASLDIARRRYASGEITKEQYDEMVATLSGAPDARPRQP